MRAKEILSDYLQKKREIGILDTDLTHLNQIVRVKTAKYGDDQGGEPLSIEEIYWKHMDEKKDIELRLAILRRDVAKVEKVLELMSMTHPHECNAMLLRHAHNKKIEYIQAQIGFSRNITVQKIKYAEGQLEELMKIK